MDPAFLAQVRARWAAVEAVVPQEMLEPCLGDILRPVGMCTQETVAGQALAAAGQSGDQPGGGGVVVLDGLRPIGWATRGMLEAAAPGASLASLREQFYPVACLSSALTLNEAVNALCTRDDDRLADPVVVMNADRVAGVVRVRDLLRIAATDGRLSASGRARLTGLPTRMRADQHMAEIIRAGADPARHADVVFVDVRAFADFNTRRGSAAGDQLIREVAELLSAVVVSQVHDAFVAHLGEDRFLITARSGQLESRLPALTAAFDDQVAADHGEDARPTLRVLHLPGAFAVAKHPRDIFRLEQRLREQARACETEAARPSSYILRMDDPGPALRIAA
jgi:GGDEF domain-containing protein